LREALWFPAPPVFDGDAEARAVLGAVVRSAWPRWANAWTRPRIGRTCSHQASSND